MPDLHVLSVFVDARGAAGNPLGVMLGAEGIDPDERQRIGGRVQAADR